MLRVVSFSVLAAVGIAALAAPAQADHRWRRHNTFFPLIDVFPGGWDDEDEYANSYDEDENEAAIPRRMKRNLRAEDKWWLYEGDESLEPVVKKPAKKKANKKKTVAKAVKTPKPVFKPSVLTASASASEMSTDIKTKKVIVTDSKSALKPVVPLATAKVQPAPEDKSIGCTAGAAVVTGYGFGDVKPKTCTGETYTFTATRGGKSFLIKLTASSGEVVDVKKL